MTVKELINKLKKLPPDLEVWFKDHDHKEHEVNDKVKGVRVVDFDFTNESDGNVWELSGKKAVIHP